MDKKTEILNAAVECFVAYGYEKTSMSDIGKRVGLNKASLYYHYKDKRDLFAAMVRSQRLIHRTRRNSALSAASPGKDRIIAFILSEIDFIEAIAVNFLKAPSAGSGMEDDAMPVYDEIIAEDIGIIESLLNETGKLPGETDAKAFAGILLKTARALLLVDCPLDGPVSERASGYERVRNDIRLVIPFMLKGAGIL